ncbi:MAG: YkgJ family cysteine cluster protein [Candidatus ainarchaeum sp.]|nr:YkgJ family cysteine cluster protein [Candidatus ainarchaeum sp.]
MGLSPKEESVICLNCGECCKKYSITILPKESKKISKFLKISNKKFLQEKCELFVKIYPKSTPGLLTCTTCFFPKKIGLMIDSILSYPPHGFFVVPQIILKRIDGNCEFLLQGNKCKIYSKRPFPCKVFPFMVVPGYEEQYPFCELFKKSGKDNVKKSRLFSKKITEYFKTVDKIGFEKTWKYFPNNGKLFLSDELIGEISFKQLKTMLNHKVKK